MLSWLASQLRLNVGSGRNRRSGLDYPSSGSTSSSLPRSPSPMGPLLDLPSQPRLCGNTQEPWGRMWTLPPQFVWEKGCALGVDKKSGQERCAASWRLRRSAAAKKWMQRVRQRGNLAPRPFAWQGYPVDGDDAREGPCWEPQKMRGWTYPGSHFGGRRAAPVLGPCVCFKLKTGVKKRPLFWPFFCAPTQISHGVFAYRSYVRGPLAAAISLTGAVGEWADRLSGVSPTLDPIARLQCKTVAWKVGADQRSSLRRNHRRGRPGLASARGRARGHWIGGRA